MQKIYTMESLPPDVQKYRTAGIWWGHEIPKGLFKKHNTARGVWGVLTVHQGAITYYDYATDSAITLVAPAIGVIPTQKYHHIEIGEGFIPEQVKIQVDFYR